MTEERISTGESRLTALSASIQVSTREKCNAGCLFCISRTTCKINNKEEDIQLCGEDRLHVGLNFANHVGATHGILTGKADPTQEDSKYVCKLIRLIREYLPLADIHTNGYLLFEDNYFLLTELAMSGLTMLTLSIASFDKKTNKKLMLLKRSGATVIEKARSLGLLVRCSLVVNKQGVADFDGVMNYIKQAGELGAQMVVIREIWKPDTYSATNNDVYKWNQENWINIKPIQDQFVEISSQKNNKYGLQERDPLPWGTPVFVVDGIFSNKNHGVNITFARCDEATTGKIIKSIVHKPDGHGYRNWDTNGDILY